MSPEEKQKKKFIKLMIAPVVIAAGFYLLYGLLKLQEPDDFKRFRVVTTENRMTTLKEQLEAFQKACSKLPSELNELTKEAPCWRPPTLDSDVMIDGWSRPIQYKAEGASYTLRSLGADGKEGGDEFDRDLIAGSSTK